MTLKEKVYENGMREIRSSNLDGTLEVQEAYLRNTNFRASTSMDSRAINFTYNPDVEEEKVLEVGGDVSTSEFRFDDTGFLGYSWVGRSAEFTADQTKQADEK